MLNALFQMNALATHVNLDSRVLTVQLDTSASVQQEQIAEKIATETNVIKVSGNLVTLKHYRFTVRII